MNHPSADVVVVGGGISGLSTAFWLKDLGYSVCLLEKDSEAGGYIKSEQIQGFLIESGPNSAVNQYDEVEELIRKLDLIKEKVEGNHQSNRRYLVKSGKLVPVPFGIFPFLTSGLWSFKGKARLLAEPFIKKRKSEQSESVASFFTRRLGREMVDYGLDPFVSGIYAGDPETLCMESTFPKVFQWEEAYGSILKGALFQFLGKRRQKRKTKKRLFSFREGMGELTRRLSEYLSGSLHTGVEVRGIERGEKPSGCVIRVSGFRGGARVWFEGKVLVAATPSDITSRFIEPFSAEISDSLRRISYAPVVLVYFGFERESVRHPLDGFGCLIPSSEGFELLGSLWNSTIFPNRAPEGFVGMTNFLGGARRPDLLHAPDEKIKEISIEELDRLVGLKKAPIFSKIIRYPRAIPQYHLGHLRRIERIDARLKELPGFYVTGNFLRGVSVGDCILEGARTAEEIHAYLSDGHAGVNSVEED